MGAKKKIENTEQYDFMIKELKEEIPKEECKFWKPIDMKEFEQQCKLIKKKVGCEGRNLQCLFYLDHMKTEKRKSDPFYDPDAYDSMNNEDDDF